MNFELLCFVFIGQIALTLQASEPSFNNKRPKNPIWESTWKDKLKQDLLLHYDKFVRPMHEGNTTTVSTDLMLRHIELDEKKFVMTLHCWLKMTWNDDKIRWNISDYNGLDKIHLAEHEIWQPDLLPYNSALGGSLDHFGNTNLLGYNNGTILWVPPTIFKVFCTMDFTRWPFDTQTCTLKLGSWTYDGEQVDFSTEMDGKTVTEMPILTPSPQWKFIQMTIKRNLVLYPCCEVPYPDLTFTVTIERHSATYKALIITPTVAVVLITLASFLVPPPFSDKLSLVGAAAIINCMILLFFMYMMPAMAGKTPNIVSFYSTTMYLVSFAVVLSVIVCNLANNPKRIPIPWILKRNLSKWLGKCLFITAMHDKENFSKAEELTDSQPVLSEQARQQGLSSEEACQKDWILLATALDRLFFIGFLFAFLILALINYV